MNINKHTQKIKLMILFIALSGIVSLLAFKGKEPVSKSKESLSNTYVYRFSGDPSNKLQVQDASLWSYDASGSACSDINKAEACTILVDATHAANPTLSGSNITITANNDINSSYFRVTGAVDGTYSATPSNKNP